MALFETCLIETSDGLIRGSIEKIDEDVYYKFKSIPYAKPPLGPLRFRVSKSNSTSNIQNSENHCDPHNTDDDKPPCPVSPWTEEKDCAQDAQPPLHMRSCGITGSEDCLYLEITTKNLKPDKPLPVMFWIGTYAYCSTLDHILDPTFLNDNGVVFVKCGFRLGPFGFLSINEFTAPGNCGLKDIVMALKWVQKNVHKFGGDPSNVTIFGGSSGGAAVHLLMLSKMASGLFHKAIIQSASALNNWSLSKNSLQPVIDLCEQLGITKTHNIEMVEELRSIPAIDIMRAFLELKKSSKYNSEVFDAIFKPCIEEEFEGLPAFLTKSPMLIIKSGKFNKVPLIIGSNYIEGSIMQHLKTDFYADFQKFNENVRLLVPRSLVKEDTTISKTIGHRLLRFYVGDEEKLTENTRSQYIQMISDYYFLYFVNKTVRLHSEISPECNIFYYIVNCAGRWNIPKKLDFFNNLGHSTEIPFIFGIKDQDSQLYEGNRESIMTRCRVTKMWTNFAKYGNPTPNEDDPLLQIKWDPVENKDKINYLNIGQELTKGRNPFQERMQFWEELHQEYSLLRMLVYFNDIGISW